MQNSCGETILLQHSAILTPLLTQQQQQQQQQQQHQHQTVLVSPVSPGNFYQLQFNSQFRRKIFFNKFLFSELTTNRENGMSLGSTTHSAINHGDSSSYLNPHHRAKKRKLSQDSSNVHVKQEPGKLK
ncbi:hypothetical protein PGB90_009451 [Kerria lacca]